ncbi:DUF2254 domain-containing protein [Pseudocolwellia sp. HL-MZ19]|uniref:DUF2254 domain-containing protein n=1 Tax=Pseudocolwellia sp. HL-MZ19 TaxID=3400846 RepID=UPI003CE99B2A
MLGNMYTDRIKFLLSRFRERLWVKPLAVCLLSIAAAFIAKLADDTRLIDIVPSITSDAIETLLSIMASSMLVIATLSVTSMVSAYASASSTATPRSFSLVVADDASQNALSTFVGAFIFSIVALTAVKNNYFQNAGIFILFVLTITVFTLVIFMFVRWVDRIARLGRIISTIDKVEYATKNAFIVRKRAPTLCGVAVKSEKQGEPIYARCVGYIQHIDIEAIDKWASKAEVRVAVATLPGTFTAPDRPLAYVYSPDGKLQEDNFDCLIDSFQIGGNRVFDNDPRFGLIVLSEIASKALSPAVNDPGTAIDVIGTLLRLFTQWNEPVDKDEIKPNCYKNVEVPEIMVEDMFDDAFTAIARGGAGLVEVSIRLQKTLVSLASLKDFEGNEGNNHEMKEAAEYYSRLALKRSKLAMSIEEDYLAVEKATKFNSAD